jgi:solute carrier family 39 (zinc transporter), member 1/2/3
LNENLSNKTISSVPQTKQLFQTRKVSIDLAKKMLDGTTISLETLLMDQRRLDEATTDGGDPCAFVATGAYDTGLHIASIFIVFIVSGLGVVLPLLSKHGEGMTINPYLIVLGKCAGIGVMLSCALVHMILPSNESLTSECLSEFFNTTFPAFAFFFALMAALTVHLAEFVLEAHLAGEDGDDDEPGKTLEATKQVDGQDSKKDSEDVQVDDSGSPRQGGELEEMEQAKKALKAKQLSEVLMVEFSLAVHSVFIGIAVGISDRTTLVGLLVALVFHQIFEGMALGARLVDSTIGYWNEVLFALIFAASAPIGIILGLSIYTHFNENGQTFLMIQGVFDGICGGILLYTGFIMLILDFPRDVAKHCSGKNKRRMVFGMFATLWICAMLMSLIGVWL